MPPIRSRHRCRGRLSWLSCPGLHVWSDVAAPMAASSLPGTGSCGRSRQACGDPYPPWGTAAAAGAAGKGGSGSGGGRWEGRRVSNAGWWRQRLVAGGAGCRSGAVLRKCMLLVLHSSLKMMPEFSCKPRQAGAVAATAAAAHQEIVALGAEPQLGPRHPA